MPLTVVQTLPALDVGGVERGTLELSAALVKKGHRSIVVSAGGRLVKQLQQEGGEHVLLPVGKKSLFTLRYIRQLRKLLQKENVSILHARSRLPAWISYFAWKALEQNSRCHFVTTVHGPYTVNRYSKIMARGEKVIAISGFIRDYIRQNYPGIDANRIEIIYRGVSPQEFPFGYRPSAEWLAAWNNQYPELSGRFLVTLPARVTRWKGQEDFLEIIRKAVARNLPVHGLVAGGPQRGKESFLQHLNEIAETSGLREHITFLGHRSDLKDIMAVSDIVFSLAREPEGFGRTALEALSIGRPVIAYDHGGAAEVLSEIFPQGRVTALDTDAAFEKLAAFYKSIPLVKQHNPFTLDRMTTKTIELYEMLAALR